MLGILTYKYRLEPTEEQTKSLLQHGGNIRFAHNQLVNCVLQYEKLNHKFPTKIELRSELKNIQQKHTFLNVSHSQPMQDIADEMFETCLKCFKPKMIQKRKEKIAKAFSLVANTDEEEMRKLNKIDKAYQYGFPKFKKKLEQKDSIYYPQGFKIRKNNVFFPKIGWIKFNKHRPIEGQVKTVTAVQDGNQWFLCVVCEKFFPNPIKIKNIDDLKITAIDIGTKTKVVTSNSEFFENPRIQEKFQEKIDSLNKRLAKKLFIVQEKEINGKKMKVSSHNREKALVKLQKITRKVKNVREDANRKLANHITATCDVVIIECLDVKDMVKVENSSLPAYMCKKAKRSLRRNILDIAPSSFYKKIEDCCRRGGKYTMELDQYFASTQTCSICGRRKIGNAKLTLKDRYYVCPHCGNVMDRDLNATLSMKKEGIRCLKILFEKGLLQQFNKFSDNKDILQNTNTLASRGINACGLETVVSRQSQDRKVLKRNKKSCERTIRFAD